LLPKHPFIEGTFTASDRTGQHDDTDRILAASPGDDLLKNCVIWSMS
jgi:hypothetical protein